MALSTQISSEQHTADRQTGSLAALATTLLLLVISLYLVDQLRSQATLQDCVLAGRSGWQCGCGG